MPAKKHKVSTPRKDPKMTAGRLRFFLKEAGACTTGRSVANLLIRESGYNLSKAWRSCSHPLYMRFLIRHSICSYSEDPTIRLKSNKLRSELYRLCRKELLDTPEDIRKHYPWPKVAKGIIRRTDRKDELGIYKGI